MEDLPTEMLLDMVVRAGAWRMEGVVDQGRVYSAMSVCKKWWHVLKESPAHMAALLAGACGSTEAALTRAVEGGGPMLVQASVHQLLALGAC